MKQEYEAVSDVVREMRAAGTSEEVAELFGIDVSDVNGIADRCNFNDKYLSVPAALGIEAKDIQSPHAIKLINHRIADLVLKKRGKGTQKAAMFHDLCPDGRLISVFEMETRLIALGIAQQKRLI